MAFHSVTASARAMDELKSRTQDVTASAVARNAALVFMGIEIPEPPDLACFSGPIACLWVPASRGRDAGSPILAGRLPEFCLERAAEVRGLLEAAFEHDVRYAHARRRQEARRAFQAP